jgi:hypothetical protein
MLTVTPGVNLDEVLALADDIEHEAAWLAEQKSDALRQYVALRKRFDDAVMPCGHARNYWAPTGAAEDFVRDPEKHGECVVCKAVREAAR